MNNATSRKAELILFVGVNGTGKSTFLNESITKTRERSLVVTPDPAEWRQYPIIPYSDIRTFKGVGRIIYEDTQTLEAIKQSFSGGNLILDDSMAYLNEQTPNTMQYLYIRRRQFGIDLYIVAHGLRQLPPKCFSFASWLVLFHSVENFSERKKDVLPEKYNTIIEAQQRIAKEVLKGNPYYKEILLLDDQIKGSYVARRKNNG